ncbi:MAG: mechanosensitive ion channel family protein [Microcystaceae cyanobacterium]
MTFKPIRYLVFFGSVILLIISLNLSAIAQMIPGAGLSDATLPSRFSVPIFTVGNLEIAPVFLDGKRVGTVTSFVDYRSQPGEQPTQPYGAAIRSELMNNNLQKILDGMTRYSREILAEQGITDRKEQEKELREQLVTSVATRRETAVVTIAFPKQQVPQLIFSVTQAEIARPRLGGSQPLLIAERAAIIIENGLIQGWRERHISYVLNQAQWALLALIILTAISFAVRLLQKYYAIRKEKLHEKFTLESQENEADSSLDEEHKLERNKIKRAIFFFKNNLSLNNLYLSALFWFQWLLWLLGLGYITSLFRWTRPLSNWITGITIRGAWNDQYIANSWPPLDWLLSFGREATLGVPLFFLLLILISRLTIKVGDTFSDFLAHTWFEHPDSQRSFLRVPTLIKVMQSWLRVIVYLLVGVTLIYHLHDLGAITSTVAVLLSFISFALSLASQNLLKDLIAGLLILSEDQYTVGDVILIDDQGGLVEKITLRITQLRNLDGELITIPNGSINIVRNLSSDWSRVNYTIEVDYNSDVDRVLEIMDEIAQNLYQDSQWSDQILEEPSILGVEKLSHQGILIRMIIKTQPLQQWPVAREFRRRLKKAFDLQGIKVGVPQQTMYVEELSSLKTNDNSQN